MEANENMMKRFLKEAKRKCLDVDDPDTEEEFGDSRCEREWDGLLCWQPALAGERIEQQCPDMLYAFDTSQSASRQCSDNGSWAMMRITEVGPSFTNYTMCTLTTKNHLATIEAFQPHIPNIKFIARMGYGISLVSLIFALIILISIKRLRCPRNCLHMNLFLSFILRATIFLIKDQIFISGVGPYDNFDGNQESVFCKLFLALFHYTLMANYCWILMEGLYLHSLVFHALSNDNSSISKYTVMGWGLPLVFIVPWAAARAAWENKLCWTTNVIAWHLWIIRGPITVSIVVNFFLFVNITRVLFVKMFVSQTPMAKRYKYRKWFKSTLVLVPLFGSHYSFLLLVSIAAELLSPQVEVYWMYIDQTFSSFQGILVALLYCFFNTEVNESMRQLSRRNPQMIYIRRVLSASRRQPPEADGRTCPRGAIKRSRSMENSCERSDFFVHDHSSNPFARKLSTTSFTDAILVHPLAAGHCNLLQVMPEVHVLTTEFSKAAKEGML